MAARIRSTILAVDVDEASRNDAGIGSIVSLVSLDAATTYAWSISFAPEGSVATFSGSASAISPGTFTCDLEGAYLIRLVIDATLPSEDVQYVRVRVPTLFGQLDLVAAGERRDGTGTIPVDVDTEGWANEQNANLRTLLSFIKPLVSSGRVLYVDANDGTDNYADYGTVQAAIDAAVAATPSDASQWVVLVRPGRYIEAVAFAPWVHVIGWPGNPDGSASEAVVIEGLHDATTSGAAQRLLLANLHIENNADTATATLTKSGAGTLRLFGCRVESNGILGTQGPAVELVGGDLDVIRSTLLHNLTGVASRVAFLQSGASTTATFDDCQMYGPTGMSVNPPSAPVVSVVCTVTNCRVQSVHASGVGISSIADTLTVDRSDIEAASGTGIAVNPTAVAFAGDVNLVVHFTRVRDDILYDITGLSGATDLNLGSVIYGALTFPGGAPAQVATTQSKTHFYDNTLSGLVAENVQDAIDEVAATASILPVVYHTNFPEVPDDTVRYRGWAPVACELLAVRVYMQTTHTVGTYTLTVTNNATGNTVLSAATFDMGTLVAATPTPVGLTGVAADLLFATLDRWTIDLTSDDPGFDGEAIYVELIFNPSTASGPVVEDLATTLLVGNITGGTDIEMTTGDEIVGQTDVILRSTGAGSNIEMFPDAAGAVVVNGKLTVTGIIDPTAVVFEQAPAPSTGVTEGAIFISDGTGGLNADEPYFRPASDGASATLTTGIATFIYQPGGTAKGNVYTDFAALVSAYNAQNQPADIRLDDTFSVGILSVPSGSHDFSKPARIYCPMATGAFLQFEIGATMSNVAEIRACIININATATVFTAPAGTPTGMNLVDGYVQSPGGGELLTIPAGRTFRMRFINTDFDPGTTIVTVAATGTYIPSLIESSVIGADSIGGAGIVTVEVGPDSVFADSQVAYSGTRTITYLDPTQAAYTVKASGAGALNARGTYVYDLAGPVSQTLPLASFGTGPLCIKNNGPGTLTLDRAGADTVNGGTSQAVAAGESFDLRSDGTSAWATFTEGGGAGGGTDTYTAPNEFYVDPALPVDATKRQYTTIAAALAAATLDPVLVRLVEGVAHSWDGTSLDTSATTIIYCEGATTVEWALASTLSTDGSLTFRRVTHDCTTNGATITAGVATLAHEECLGGLVLETTDPPTPALGNTWSILRSDLTLAVTGGAGEATGGTLTLGWSTVQTDTSNTVFDHSAGAAPWLVDVIDNSQVTRTGGGAGTVFLNNGFDLLTVQFRNAVLKAASAGATTIMSGGFIGVSWTNAKVLNPSAEGGGALVFGDLGDQAGLEIEASPLPSDPPDGTRAHNEFFGQLFFKLAQFGAYSQWRGDGNVAYLQGDFGGGSPTTLINAFAPFDPLVAFDVASILSNTTIRIRGEVIFTKTGGAEDTAIFDVDAVLLLTSTPGGSFVYGGTPSLVYETNAGRYTVALSVVAGVGFEVVCTRNAGAEVQKIRARFELTEDSES